MKFILLDFFYNNIHALKQKGPPNLHFFYGCQIRIILSLLSLNILNMIEIGQE